MSLDLTSPHTQASTEADRGFSEQEQMHQLITHNPNNQPPDTTKKKTRGRPKEHGLSGTPSYESYKAAKRRCDDPDFTGYHGRGIEFHFSSPQELVEEIGLRPDGTELDRIDPDGHYTHGNVRWRNKSENRGSRRDPDHFRQTAIEAKQYREDEGQRLWIETARHWSLSIRYFIEFSLPNAACEELDRFSSEHPSKDCPVFTVYPGRDRDSRGNALGLIGLPSLTAPGERAVLTIPANWHSWSKQQDHLNRGIINGLANMHPTHHCTREEIAIVDNLVSSYREQSGLLLLSFIGKKQWSSVMPHRVV
jgi:hypothetical protein